MGKYKFSLSDMIPNAWFYKLKDMNSNRSKYNSSQSQSQSQSQSTTKKKLNATTISPHFSQPLYFSAGHNSDSIKIHGFQNSTFSQKSSSDTHFPEPARKSWRRRRSRRKTVYKPSPRERVVINPVFAACSCHVSLSSVVAPANPRHSWDSSLSSIECSPRSKIHEGSPSEDEGTITASSDDVGSSSSPCKCTLRSSHHDIIIDMNSEWVGRRAEKLRGSNWTRELDQLPPFSRNPMILDKKASEATKLRTSPKTRKIKANQSLCEKTVEEEDVRTAEKPTGTGVRKSSGSPVGVRIRGSSPSIGRRKIQTHARRNVASDTRLKSKSNCLSESFAMVKASQNPQQDFRESMVEMIVENNIRSSEDLEDLLACYLILNSDEYHDLIIKTFEQIWFDMAELRI